MDVMNESEQSLSMPIPKMEWMLSILLTSDAAH